MVDRAIRGLSEPEKAERRMADRRDYGVKRRKVVLSARLFEDGQWHNVIVTNLSEIGFGGRSKTLLRASENVFVSLKRDLLIEARIAWFDKGRFGVEFLEPIVLADHLPRGIEEASLCEDLGRRVGRIAMLGLDPASEWKTLPSQRLNTR